ncbi:MAG: hypothetical protein HY586_02575 [Candidatus Omnitrophica bacterium]|nr:hypothetical protein [Candidatus Omnitrophota bacterium]
MKVEEESLSRLTRGEIRFIAPAPGEPGQKAKLVWITMIVLVLFQAVLFAWACIMMNEAQKAVKKAENLVVSLQEYTAKIQEMKSKPVEAVTGIAYSFDHLAGAPVLGKNLLVRKKYEQSKLDRISINYEEEGRLGKAGKGMKVDYEFMDIFQHNNWMALEFFLPEMKLNQNSRLTFWLRGNAKRGYNPQAKIEFSDAVKTHVYPVSNIGTFWKKVSIPFSQIRSGVNLEQLKSIRFVVENERGSDKAGGYFLDGFRLVRHDN